MLTIARIRDGLVVNIEVASQDWLDAEDGPDTLIPYTDANPAWIGLGWTLEAGFEQPEETP